MTAPHKGEETRTQSPEEWGRAFMARQVSWEAWPSPALPATDHSPPERQPDPFGIFQPMDAGEAYEQYLEEDHSGDSDRGRG